MWTRASRRPTSSRARPPSKPHGLSALIAAFRAWRERQAAINELEMMSDRELADIGLNRADVHRVFDHAVQPGSAGPGAGLTPDGLLLRSPQGTSPSSAQHQRSPDALGKPAFQPQAPSAMRRQHPARLGRQQSG